MQTLCPFGTITLILRYYDSRQQTAPYIIHCIILHVLYHCHQWAQLLPTLGRTRLATPYTYRQVIASNHTQSYNGQVSHTG